LLKISRISEPLEFRNACFFEGFPRHILVFQIPSPSHPPPGGEGKGNPKTAGIQKRMRFEWFPRHVLVFRDFPPPPPRVRREGGGGTSEPLKSRSACALSGFHDTFWCFEIYVLVFREFLPPHPQIRGGGGLGGGRGGQSRTAGIQNRATARGSWILKTAPEAAFRNGVALLTC